MKKTLAVLLALLMVVPMLVFPTAAETPQAESGMAEKIIPITDCDTNTGMSPDSSGVVDTTDPYQGEASLATTVNGVVAQTAKLKYQFVSPIVRDVSEMKTIVFDFYVSDPAAFQYTRLEIEIRSKGHNTDENEKVITPTLVELAGGKLVKGWNHAEVSIFDMGQAGNFDPTQWNYFRIFNRQKEVAHTFGLEGETTVFKLDNVYFTSRERKLTEHENMIGVPTAAGYYGNVSQSGKNAAGGSQDIRWQMAYNDSLAGVGQDISTMDMVEFDVWIGDDALNDIAFFVEVSSSGRADANEYHIPSKKLSNIVGRRLTVGEWNHVAVPLQRFVRSVGATDFTNWNFFRIFNTGSGSGTTPYPIYFANAKFTRDTTTDDKVFWTCEDNSQLGGGLATEVKLMDHNSGVYAPKLGDIDGDGTNELIIIDVEGDGSFGGGGGYNANSAGVKGAGIKCGIQVCDPTRTGYSNMTALRFDIYIENATLLNQSFWFELTGESGSDQGEIAKNATLRSLFGNLQVGTWNTVTLPLSTLNAKTNGSSAPFAGSRFDFIRIHNAGTFSYTGGCAMAIANIEIVREAQNYIGSAAPGQTKVLTFDSSWGSKADGGHALYVVDADKNDTALRWAKFDPSTQRGATRSGFSISSANLIDVTKLITTADKEAISVCFTLGWEVGEGSSDSFLSHLLASGQWCFEVRSTAYSDNYERQWTKNLSFYVPQLTNTDQGRAALRAGGTYEVEVDLSSVNDRADATPLNLAKIAYISAFFQETYKPGATDSAEFWIDNLYFKTRETPKADIKGASLSLTDTFNVTFSTETNVMTSGAAMDLEWHGEHTLTQATANGTYAFNGILAQNMYDEITATFWGVDAFGVLTKETVTYSVRDYCAKWLGKDDATIKADAGFTTDAQVTAFRQLLSAALRYGAAAQTYASYNTDQLATAGVSGLVEAPAFDASNIETIESLLSGEYVSGAKWRSATLVLGNSMAIRYAFTADSVDGLKVNCSNGQTYSSFLTATDDKGVTFYYIDVPVYANEFDETFTVSFDGVENYDLSYSVNHYVATKHKPEQIKTAALLEAIYNYGVAADAFAAQ